MQSTHSERRFAELEALNRIAAEMAAAGDPAEAILPALRLLESHLNMRHATLALLDSGAGRISIDLASDLTSEQIGRGRYRLGEGVTGKVAASGVPAVIPSTSECPDFLDRTTRGDRRGDSSFICVPVVVGREILGTLSLDGGRRPEEELWESARLLGTVAALLAQAIRMRRESRERQAALTDENERLRGRLKERVAPRNIIGGSREMRIVLDQIYQAASSRSTVLINGETGTGKELVAEALHYNGDRARKPFVKVNCAALPESLIESELFGHEKGAFTGAVARRRGRFEQADGGTIFLDEIGDISRLMQVKLLRVLQEREFERVGGVETIRVDVRVIAATHRDLFAMAREGRFRSDLFYRINVFPIYLLPLRRRLADIPLLADFFLKKYAGAAGKRIDSISPEAQDIFSRHSWPGNVRELENCIEHAVILAGGNSIGVEHLPASLRFPGDDSGPRPDFKSQVENFERGLLMEALKTTRGNISQAAQLLGTTQRIISYRSRQLGLDPAKFAASP
ncbi:MAG: sigma 54-interacting transcriptional regulator [Planctomycetota bacterium]|jgi:Nif-specific regulatory protein|nr:sigma 54-interacting transcriptional regulator [Planctomycetota bacterium]